MVDGGGHIFIFIFIFIFTFTFTFRQRNQCNKERCGIGSSRRLMFSTKFRAPPLSASLSAGERGGYHNLPILCEIEFIVVDGSPWKSLSSDGHDPIVTSSPASPDPLEEGILKSTLCIAIPSDKCALIILSTCTCTLQHTPKQSKHTDHSSKRHT